MKKLLNILGYISLVLIPYMLILFQLGLHTPVKIISIIGLIAIVLVQILHFKKTEIRYIGIRILITIFVIILITMIAIYSYGFIKNIEAQKLWDTVDKIEMREYALEKEDLKDAKIEFVKDKFILTKGSQDAIIYYKDGSIEKIKILFTGSPDIFQIKGEKYYIRNLPIY